MTVPSGRRPARRAEVEPAHSPDAGAAGDVRAAEDRLARAAEESEEARWAYFAAPPERIATTGRALEAAETRERAAREAVGAAEAAAGAGRRERRGRDRRSG